MVISNYVTITFPTGLGLPTGEIPVLMKDYVDYPRWNPNSAKAVYGPGYGHSYPLNLPTGDPGGYPKGTFRLISDGILYSGIGINVNSSGGPRDLIWNDMYHIWTT